MAKKGKGGTSDKTASKKALAKLAKAVDRLSAKVAKLEKDLAGLKTAKAKAPARSATRRKAPAATRKPAAKSTARSAAKPAAKAPASRKAPAKPRAPRRPATTRSTTTRPSAAKTGA